MARLNEQGINAVKKAVGVAALTGPTGQTMGQAGKSAKQGTLPAFEGDKMPMGGQLKEVTITGSPIKKPEELKMGTYQLPAVVRIGGYSVDVKDIKQALKKILSTYGESSKEFKNFMSSTGANLSKDYEILSFTQGETYKKPDLRKDSKSYVDTAQTSFNQSPYIERRNPSPYQGREYRADANVKSDNETIELLDKLGYDVFKRNLFFDKGRSGR
jgi:hypothetical protein